VSLITVIGRGHSGTRAMSQTLSASGVFMGEPLNRSGDLLPPGPMYEACRIFARHVGWHGGLQWDWAAAQDIAMPTEFSDLIQTYLASVLDGTAQHKGWKLPETTLVFPWIVRLFPDAKYILWVRDPRDCILGGHLTDDLADWGIPYPPTEDERERRAISWAYQYALVEATPKPRNWIEVRFEDFVLRQDETLARLTSFLGFPLAKIEVNPGAVGRWRSDAGVTTFGFLKSAMARYGYDLGAPSMGLPVEAQEACV
jgi:hypothetical protein